jgi:hypothetical protein
VLVAVDLALYRAAFEASTSAPRLHAQGSLSVLRREGGIDWREVVNVMRSPPPLSGRCFAYIGHLTIN